MASSKHKRRIVIYYRKLKEKTIDDRCPIPNITDLLDKLHKCQYFSTIEFASGFRQIEMSKGSISKTVFNEKMVIMSFYDSHYSDFTKPFLLITNASKVDLTAIL